MRDDPQRWYAEHGHWTDPGSQAGMLDDLPDGIAPLMGIVQGLLIHDAGLHLYGLTADAFATASRDTRPVSDRLATALVSGRLSEARAPTDRALGTCRDYALLTTALLRHQGTPARVRCGFATYFRPGFHADHWITERWLPRERRWARADAQLDGPHRSHLGIGFDISDMPDGAFLTGGEAWRLVRSGAADPATFGHGTACGEWFMRVNLARDLLALGKHEVSDWDRWREAAPQDHSLDDKDLAWCDVAAALAGSVDHDLGSITTPPMGIADRLDSFRLHPDREQVSAISRSGPHRTP